MKLYSGPLSLFTAKVRIALEEKGIPYERIEVGWSLAARYEPHHPDVVALNPKKQVPVLVDGDVAVYDSTLILEYLEERNPSPPLYPSELALRARCRQLEAAADEIVFPAVWELINGGFYPVAAGDTAAAERHRQAKSRVAELCQGLDKELVGREYLCGRFSVADIGTYIMVSTAATLGAPPPASCSQLQAWLGRMSARPAVRNELTAMAAHAAKARKEADPSRPTRASAEGARSEPKASEGGPPRRRA